MNSKPLIPRARVRHLIGNPSAIDSQDKSQMAAEIERLHQRLGRERLKTKILAALLDAATSGKPSTSTSLSVDSATVNITSDVDPLEIADALEKEIKKSIRRRKTPLTG